MLDDLTAPNGLLSVFNSLPGAYLLVSPDLVIEAASNAYLDVTLATREKLIGLFIFDAFPSNPHDQGADGMNDLHASLQRVLATGKPHQMGQVRYDIPDPQQPGQFLERYWLPANTPVLNNQGEISHIIHSIVNVTDHVLAEKSRQNSLVWEEQARHDAEDRRLALNQSEARQTEVLAYAQRLAQERETYYQIFEQTPAAICIQRGPEHRYEYLNAAYQQFFPDRQLQGRPVAEAVPETISGGFVAQLDRVYQTGEIYYGNESRLLLEQPGGAPPVERFFTFTYQPFREKGQIIGVSTFAYDVTDQVIARRQREAQQQQLHNLFEQAPVAISIFRTPDYIIEIANPLVTAIWGRTPDQVLGKPLFEALPEVKDQGFREILDEVVQTGTPHIAREVEVMLKRDGQLERVYLDFVYHPLQDEKGNITSVAAVATEITGQVAARQQLAQANQELKATNQELDIANQQLTRTNIDLDSFIYTASHDLKAPILNIEALMTALQEELSPQSQQSEMVKHTSDLIFDSIKRFKRTIEQLTEISKLQKENRAEASQVNLAAIIHDVQLDLAPSIQATQARIEVDVERCPNIRFSEKNLRSIIYNLLSNAIKYYVPGRVPLVQVSCQVTEQYQVLSVQDNGLGIDMAQQKKLFAMFQRLHDHVEGSGIGLYMVKKIIENAGGKVEVQSNLNEGSTFKVYFLLAR